MNGGAPTEVVFLPGFDGFAELRAPFVAALAQHHPARAIGYPNRKLDSLSGYARYVAAQMPPDARPVVVAESFSGLVAARWAAQDPHVAGVILCGAFGRNPTPWTSFGASMPAVAKFVGSTLLNPMTGDAARRRWSQGFAAALAALDRDVIAERMRLIATEDVRAELRALRIPVVLVQFDDDLVISSRARGELEAVCHNAQVVRFKGPHFAIEVRPRESAAAIREPLAAIFRGATGRTAGET